MKQQPEPNVDTDLTALSTSKVEKALNRNHKMANSFLKEKIIRGGTEEFVTTVRESILVTIHTFLQSML